MSQAEIERFVAAIRSNPELGVSYGTAADLTELAARLRADGYDVGEAEVAEAASRPAERPDAERPDGSCRTGSWTRCPAASGSARPRPCFST